MHRAVFLVVMLCAFMLAAMHPTHAAPAVGPLPPKVAPGYAIIATKSPTPIHIEVISPYKVAPGADLVVIQPDGTEAILYDADEDQAVVDPRVSFDAKTVFFSLSKGWKTKHPQGWPRQGFDLYSLPLYKDANGFVTTDIAKLFRITNQERDLRREIPTGIPVINLGPYPVPGGRLMYTSTATNQQPNKGFAKGPVQMLYVIDQDGKNREQINFANTANSWHPIAMMDGRYLYASQETFMTRDPRQGGLFHINQDGTGMGQVWSAFMSAKFIHFHGQATNGDIFSNEYYNKNNNGFGTIHRQPLEFFGQYIREPIARPKWRLRPKGVSTITTWAHGGDQNAMSRMYPHGSTLPRNRDDLPISYMGKANSPSATKDNRLLVTWSGNSRTNKLNRAHGTHRVFSELKDSNGRPLRLTGADLASPSDHQMIVRLKVDQQYATPEETELIAAAEDGHYAQPVPVLTYAEIFNQPEPTKQPWLPSTKQQGKPDHVCKLLPAGSPFGLIGTKSNLARDTAGIARWFEDISWKVQGTDGMLYEDKDIHSITILQHESFQDTEGLGRHLKGTVGYNGETVRELGTFILRKEGNPKDPDGKDDTSFMVKVPADTSISMLARDKHGNVLNNHGTWLQVRPGEVRVNCNGCHDHVKHDHGGHLENADGIDYPGDSNDWFWDGAAAAKKDYLIRDLANATPVINPDDPDEEIVKDVPHRTYAYRAHILPMMRANCLDCHGNAKAEGELNFESDETTGTSGRGPTDVYPGGTIHVSYRKIIPKNTGGRTHLLKLVANAWGRQFSPKPADRNVFKSLIGVEPSEGCKANERLNNTQRAVIMDWVAAGAAYDAPYVGDNDQFKRESYLEDKQRPILHLDSPRRRSASPATLIRLGAFDDNGLQAVSVTASFQVGSNSAGTNLWPLMDKVADGVYSIDIGQPMESGEVSVRAVDAAGNVSTVNRSFALSGDTPPPPPAAPTINKFIANKTSVKVNEVFNLTWEVAGQDVEVSINGQRQSSATGSVDRKITAAGTVTYKLTATNEGGTVSGTVQVTAAEDVPVDPCEDLKKQIAQMQTQINALNAQITSLNATVAEQQATITEQSNTITTQKAMVTQLQGQVTALQGEVTKLKADLAAEQDKIKRISDIANE